MARVTRGNQVGGRTGLILPTKRRLAVPVSSGIVFANHWLWVARRDGKVLWEDETPNLVVNVGLDDLLDKYLKASGYTAAFYLGLTDGTPTVAGGDTMSSHAGWAEVTAYDESARGTLAWGSVSSQSVSATPLTFTISSNGTTIGGGFITTVATKGATTGTLFSAAAFSAGDKSLDDGDTLDVTPTVSASSS